MLAGGMHEANRRSAFLLLLGACPWLGWLPVGLLSWRKVLSLTLYRQLANLRTPKTHAYNQTSSEPVGITIGSNLPSCVTH